MTSIKEQQSHVSLSEVSQNNIKALVAPMREWVRKQGETDEKTYGQLVNIAHKR
jgi:hypothetical protein